MFFGKKICLVQIQSHGSLSASFSHFDLVVSLFLRRHEVRHRLNHRELHHLL
ncbi:hypothetical protein TanjilG_25181 [Lupinus angustifolius]|uniref:Uncharacterized protein n=1 Tax=Lupinus angustifolius TaxID=3871 RepID=A0A1J7G586_LUPAN|nr:hypothetical protein TanjilG_25181 [Lupinus angustifolius]